MRQSLAVVTTLLGGCSFIYNPDHIGKDAHVQDGTPVDAELDAHVTLDADPSMLTLQNIAPATIYEGQGAPGTNSLPVLVVIGGHNITDAFTLTVTTMPPNNADIIVGTAQRSHSGDYIVVPIGMKVNGGVDAMAVPLTFTVDEPGAPTQMISGVSLQYLPQLDGANGTGAIVVDTTMVKARYSEILAGAVTFTGGKRVALKSMSKIAVASITATGGNASTNTAGGPGIGGCAGGGDSMVGGCTLGGGNSSANGDGGGGGGYGSKGGTNNGGSPHGDPQIMTYDGLVGDGTDVNQSSGGGGGSKTAGLASADGAGGGGGGTVELDAEGDITIAAAGSINVNGGNGGTATPFLGLGGGGGGGGGSGGLVIVRSVNGTISSTITAAGGAGGGASGTGTGGGAGGLGRVRWDSPQADPLTATGLIHRAPSFTALAQITTTNTPTLTLAGSTDDIVDFYLTDGAGGDHTGEMQGQMFVSGAISFEGKLVDGFNNFCAVIHGGTNHTALNESCVELVYLPD